MAVTVLTEPGTRTFISESVPYKISTDSLASSGNYKKIGLEVYVSDTNNSNEVLIMPLKTIPVNSLSDILEVDLRDIVRSSLSTPLPDLDGSVAVIAADDFSKKVRIKHFEIEIDPTDSNNNTVTSAFTDGKEIVNCYVQPYQTATNSANMMLTDKNVVHIPNDAHDWVLCYGNGTLTISYKNNSGGEISQQTINFASTSLVPSGPAQLTLPTGTVSYTLSYGGKTVKYIVDNPRWDVSQRVDIYFREAKGSWSMMPFKFLESEVTNKTFDELCMGGYVVSSRSDLYANYGRSINTIRNWMGITLSKLDNTREDTLEFKRAFANAREYRAVFRGAEGNLSEKLAPLIPNVTSHTIATRKGFFENEFSAFYGLDLR